MTVVHKSVLLQYSAEQMFALVERVEDYPQFLPWCGGVTVRERSDDRLIATIAIDYRGIRQAFTTENRNRRPISMDMHLVEGPFRRFEARWTFRPLRADACKVEFDMEYEFSGRILDKMIGPVFGMIASSFVDSFCKRAEQLYG